MEKHSEDKPLLTLKSVSSGSIKLIYERLSSQNDNVIEQIKPKSSINDYYFHDKQFEIQNPRAYTELGSNIFTIIASSNMQKVGNIIGKHAAQEGEIFTNNLSALEIQPSELLLHQTDATRTLDTPFIDQQTAKFIKDCNLENSIEWLREVAPTFFANSSFEMELLTGHDDEDDFILDFRVYNSQSLLTFREQRQEFIDRMIQDNHQTLFRLLSITHWRREHLGWQGIPRYSPAPS